MIEFYQCIENYHYQLLFYLIFGDKIQLFKVGRFWRLKKIQKNGSSMNLTIYIGISVFT